ncbi:Threonylcarbamoyl-AMP synthase [Candidatus Ecksteinia adelgidicola]|nr:Threonylcarbamoyl-AMP synthase [Candidatus Ecksteinia adelgidicola]
MNLKITSSLSIVLNALQNKKIIAYPTEAVFSLGCDPSNEEAVSNLLIIKQRSWKKGLILIAANYQQLNQYINNNILNTKQRNIMFSTWPGPTTWIVPAHPKTPRHLTGIFNSIAVRVSAHPTVQKLCQKYGKPLISTSANISQKNPCRNIKDLIQEFSHFPILVLDGKVSGAMNPSEIRDILNGNQIRKG